MTTYALVGASEFSSEQFSARNGAGAFDAVIAVDGGFASLAAVGCAPDLAIGDFDVAGIRARGGGSVCVPAGEGRLRHGAGPRRGRRPRRRCRGGLRALGGRLDHTLANLQLLASFAERGLTVTAVGERERIAFLVGPGELRLDAAGAGIVSVFSLTDVSTGVVEEGLKYGLDGVALTNRTSWGLSNEFIGTPARIALESGTLAVFLPL